MVWGNIAINTEEDSAIVLPGQEACFICAVGPTCVKLKPCKHCVCVVCVQNLRQASILKVRNMCWSYLLSTTRSASSCSWKSWFCSPPDAVDKQTQLQELPALTFIRHIFLEHSTSKFLQKVNMSHCWMATGDLLVLPDSFPLQQERGTWRNAEVVPQYKNT
jgi:hypothetical protein